MDTISSERRSENMRRIRSRDTGPEMVVRRLAHSIGLRFRLHRKDLPGKPDLVFPGRRKIIFVHGCYWHGHDDPTCKRGHRPKSNLEYWTGKIAKNKERDEVNIATIRDAGWSALVIWECQTNDQQALRELITEFLQGD